MERGGLFGGCAGGKAVEEHGVAVAEVKQQGEVEFAVDVAGLADLESSHVGDRVGVLAEPQQGAVAADEPAGSAGSTRISLRKGTLPTIGTTARKNPKVARKSPTPARRHGVAGYRDAGKAGSATGDQQGDPRWNQQAEPAEEERPEQRRDAPGTSRSGGWRASVQPR